MQIHASMLALHTDRPVKMVYNREESFTGHVHRHPARIWAQHRATRDGRLVCVHVNILLDGGAYASSSTAVVSNASSFALGSYRVDNALIEGTCVYTNNPPCGAMRGFGAVQTCFAGEAQMDLLAAELGIDPVELRLLNAIEPGDQLPTGQVLTGSLPVAEVIRQAAAIPVPEAEPLPRDPIRLPGGAGNTTRGDGVRRGVGFAVGFKNICFSEGFDDYCSARVQLHADGSATLHSAAAEVGQGVGGVMSVDLAFGGAFYATIEERVEPRELPRLIELGRDLKRTLEAEHEIVHPLEPELRDVYGVIFWQHEGEVPFAQRNVTVFADGEVDRSPCGSGTSARLALLDASGRLPRGETLHHRSIVGSEFTARVVGEAEVAGRPAVITEVTGAAYRTGESTFTLDPDDPVGEGFLLR